MGNNVKRCHRSTFNNCVFTAVPWTCYKWTLTLPHPYLFSPPKLNLLQSKNTSEMYMYFDCFFFLRTQCFYENSIGVFSILFYQQFCCGQHWSRSARHWGPYGILWLLLRFLWGASPRVITEGKGQGWIKQKLKQLLMTTSVILEWLM